MPPPTELPIGLAVSRTGRHISRAFDQALSAAGASLPTWLVLVSLQGAAHRAQRDLARAVGVEGPTLTHHLNRLEAGGLVIRRRDPENRRVHQVELTDAGRALFLRLLDTVAGFDRQLQAGLEPDEVVTLRRLLARIGANVEPPDRADVVRPADDAGEAGDHEGVA